jgi:hypothetical protein
MITRKPAGRGNGSADTWTTLRTRRGDNTWG